MCAARILVVVRVLWQYMLIAGSSNGRTTSFGLVNWGSIPCPAAKHIECTLGGVFNIFIVG